MICIVILWQKERSVVCCRGVQMHDREFMMDDRSDLVAFVYKIV